MRTNFSTENSLFSDKAHLAVHTQLYPFVFNVTSDHISYESVTLSNDPTDPRHQIMNGEMAIDRIVNVSLDYLTFPLTYTVQERFRRTTAKKWQDITITEHNNS